MRLLTFLLVAGMCAFSGGLAFAQAPEIDTLLPHEGHDTTTLTATMTTHDGSAASISSAPHAHAADAMAPAVVLPTIGRLRPVGSALATVMAQATARSTTFRQLVHAIGESDGIVYVEHGRCGHGVRACLLDVTAAGTNRIVRVRVDAHKIDWDLMGSIGHELQHAVEVLREPRITSTPAMHAFYRQQGRLVANVFETPAAIRAGNAVRTEARRPNRWTPVR